LLIYDPIIKFTQNPNLESCLLGSVWLCCSTCFSANFKFFFFLLKLSAVCTFWIVLMCWYQKWFLKNKKTSLVCISARKAIWKATITTLPNTLLIMFAIKLGPCSITLCFTMEMIFNSREREKMLSYKKHVKIDLKRNMHISLSLSHQLKSVLTCNHRKVKQILRYCLLTWLYRIFLKCFLN